MHASYKREEYMFAMYLDVQTMWKKAENISMQNYGHFFIPRSFFDQWLLLHAAVKYCLILINVIWDYISIFQYC